jgi:hypothetical protein
MDKHGDGTGERRSAEAVDRIHWRAEDVTGSIRESPGPIREQPVKQRSPGSECPTAEVT